MTEKMKALARSTFSAKREERGQKWRELSAQREYVTQKYDYFLYSTLVSQCLFLLPPSENCNADLEASIEPEKTQKNWRDCLHWVHPLFSQPDSDLNRLTICLPTTRRTCIIQCAQWESMFACLCLENEPQEHSQDGNLNNSPGNVLNLTVAIEKWVNMDINIDKETSHSLIPKTTLSIVHSLSLSLANEKKGSEREGNQ